MARAAAARVPAPARRASARTAPARPARRPAPATRPAAASRARIAVRSHSATLLDRLLHSPALIGLVFVLLVGVVFSNVVLLQKSRGITQASARATMIKHENARLRAEVARLGSSERIQQVAAERGLVLPAPGEVRYLRSRPSIDARNASQRIGAGATTEQPVQ
jgi:cell division protein FtsL